MGLNENRTTDASSKVNIVVGNINGEQNAGRGHRRDLIIANVIRRSPVKPDFLALQDGVRGIDVKEFVDALNQKWPGSSYCDVPLLRGEASNAARNKGQLCSTYRDNREALLYDKILWERATEHDGFFQACSAISQTLLNTRCRIGFFKEVSSGNDVVVVSCHGEQWKPKKDNENREELPLQRKEDFLRSLLQDLVAYVAFEMSRKTSLFFCGDFNFDITRHGFMNTLPSKEFDIFPKRQDRKRPIDFVLVRGMHVNVNTCAQRHPSKPSSDEQEYPPTARLGAEKIENATTRINDSESVVVKKEELLQLVQKGIPISLRLKVKDEEEKAQSLSITVSLASKTKDEVEVSITEITSASDSEEGYAPHQTTLTIEGSNHVDEKSEGAFDHDFIYLSAEVNCAVKEESPQPETVYGYKSPRPHRASCLILHNRNWNSKELISQDIIEYEGVSYMRFTNLTITQQKKLYRLVRKERRANEEWLIRFSS